MNPKVSIIVPIYNCGDNNVIKNLVSNVSNQTEKSWELLLCNDGSTDNTLAICKRLEQKDKRIKVIDCKHRGVSATRNTGIDNATGEWITFIDADDGLTGVFLESMLSAAKRCCQADLVCCSYIVMDNQTANNNLYSDSEYNGAEQICRLFEETNFLRRCSPWARMFRTSTIRENNIRFDANLTHSEDRLFLYDFLQYAHSIATTSSIGYFYGSFSASSLKHAKLTKEEMFYRQESLTRAGIRLMNKFNIHKEKSFCIGGNLINLLLNSAENIVLTSHNRNAQIDALSQFVSEYFSVDILKRFEQDKRFQAKSSDRLCKLLLSKNYSAFINIIKRQNSILNTKLFFHKLLGLKSQSKEFASYISKIN